MHRRSQRQPFALINLPGILVLFKPENWEVNRGDPDGYRARVDWNLMSDWLISTFSRTVFPLIHSSTFDFGFIHRLDVPSSGIVVSATTFTGLAVLRWQLDTYRLCRDYSVLCHGALYDPSLRQVDLRINKSEAESKKSHASEDGMPALTYLSCTAHGYPKLDADASCSLLLIKIRTGRHHQIRAHLTEIEHVTVADGRYSQKRVLLQDKHILSDMRWFERTFDRAVVPLFTAHPKIWT